VGEGERTYFIEKSSKKGREKKPSRLCIREGGGCRAPKEGGEKVPKRTRGLLPVREKKKTDFFEGERRGALPAKGGKEKGEGVLIPYIPGGGKGVLHLRLWERKGGKERKVYKLSSLLIKKEEDSSSLLKKKRKGGSSNFREGGEGGGRNTAGGEKGEWNTPLYEY